MSWCSRHPEKRARRKCFRCKAVVCLECYYRREHHIFCSSACYLRWAASDRRNRIGDLFAARIPIPLVLVVLLALTAPFGWFLLQAAIELDAPVPFMAVERRHRVVATSAVIDTIEEGEEAMWVKGRATPGSVVILMRDGKAVTNRETGPGGKFAFELELQTAASTYAVAAIPSASIASASWSPSRTIDLARLPEPPVRSNTARFVESFTRGPSTASNVVLSLDAGSSDVGAREILATLRTHHIRTTVFLTGAFVRKFPDVTREIIADGHEVGNHTDTHPHLTSFAKNRRHLTLPEMTRERFLGELKRTEDAFRVATGQEMARYWRAPFGEENSEIRGWAAELGYLHVGWTRGRKYNLDSLDWVVDERSPIYFTPDQLVNRLLSFDVANGTTLNGGIILMHLGSDRSEDTRLAGMLPKMIEEFRSKGFQFVTVSELREAAHAGQSSTG